MTYMDEFGAKGRVHWDLKTLTEMFSAAEKSGVFFMPRSNDLRCPTDRRWQVCYPRPVSSFVRELGAGSLLIPITPLTETV